MDESDPQIGPDERDPIRTYTPEEDVRLCRQLVEAAARVHAGHYSSRPVDTALLQELHAALFEGVREHAGRVRRPGSGSRVVTFGWHRSVLAKDVDARLAAVWQVATRSLRSLGENTTDPRYEESALHVAVWAHCEVIRIHPFEDGNGRASRLLLDVILVRLGLRPIPVEVPKQEYLMVLNAYFGGNGRPPGSIRGVIDLFLRLWDEQIPRPDGPQPAP